MKETLAAQNGKSVENFDQITAEKVVEAVTGGDPLARNVWDETIKYLAVGIGNVVDLTAEGVDLEHRLALRTRQDPHRCVKRTAGRGRPGTCVGRRLDGHAPAARFDTAFRPNTRRVSSVAIPLTL